MNQDSDLAGPPATNDPAALRHALGQLIASQLGLRGFTLLLAVEQAQTPEELQDLVARVLQQIGARQGAAAADAARQVLQGTN